MKTSPVRALATGLVLLFLVPAWLGAQNQATPLNRMDGALVTIPNLSKVPVVIYGSNQQPTAATFGRDWTTPLVFDVNSSIGIQVDPTDLPNVLQILKLPPGETPKFSDIFDEVNVGLGAASSRTTLVLEPVPLPDAGAELRFKPMSVGLLAPYLEDGTRNFSLYDTVVVELHFKGDISARKLRYYASLRQTFLVSILGISAFYLVNADAFKTTDISAGFLNPSSVAVGTDIFKFRFQVYDINGLHSITMVLPSLYTILRDSERSIDAGFGMGILFDINDTLSVGIGNRVAPWRQEWDVQFLVGTNLVSSLSYFTSRLGGK